jgi:hypothetical protein
MNKKKGTWRLWGFYQPAKACKREALEQPTVPDATSALPD